MALGDWAIAADFALDYLKENYGSQVKMLWSIKSDNQRLGQAFFNALSARDQAKIRTTIFDPYYKTDTECIWKAIEFLMDN